MLSKMQYWPMSEALSSTKSGKVGHVQPGRASKGLSGQFQPHVLGLSFGCDMHSCPCCACASLLLSDIRGKKDLQCAKAEICTFLPKKQQKKRKTGPLGLICLGFLRVLGLVPNSEFETMVRCVPDGLLLSRAGM